MDFPPCFGSREEWLDYLRLASESPPTSFCQDCTPEYQSEMTAAGKCVGRDVVFVEVVDEDGDVMLAGYGSARTINSYPSYRWCFTAGRNV